MTYPVDPEYRPLMEYVPVLDIADPSSTRERLRAQATTDPMSLVPESVEVIDEVAPVSDGTDVGLVVFRPAAPADRALPVVLYFHGGGFVLGDARTDVRVPARLAADLDAVVVSVNYRLAPEHPYPAPFDDGYAALEWVAAAEGHGFDPSRVVVAGTSAGAGLAAAVALKARDTGGPTILFQALDSPVVDDRLVTDSSRRYTDTPMWTRQNAIDSWGHYLGGETGRDSITEYAAPARARDFSGLPPAYIAVTSFDPLRDEGIDYARALLGAGVPTELHLSPGTFHGATSLFPHAEISQRVNAAFTSAIRRALESDRSR
ncbi:alpha/beta hydrolase [Dietzia sp. CH92]|uniref:alpha/beta hydrolase n=1 Tax=Dietzia sp. CH92 TaxID=3051823 RepID=UPI0028D021A3|nr:alpha/beta hydrolase [Dietzia sp. CH92]